MIRELINSLPPEIDLCNAEHAALLDTTVDALLAEYSTQDELKAVEQQVLDKNDGSLTFILQALKVARSKTIVSKIDQPITVSVVFAVYKEHNRILTQGEHPHGEDFLRKKLHQMEGLFSNNPNINFQLLVVDDGCPEGSGKIAQRIIDQDAMKNVEVLFLADAIENGLGAISSLGSTADSQKGGSIIYGMWHASQKQVDGEHIIVFTDADLSTHLGQLGLLIDPILNQKKNVAIGSRRESDSVVIKKGTRNDRGKLFIYLWKRMIPTLNAIIDTQCGFKAFDGRIMSQLLERMIEFRFAFDIELLLKAAQHDAAGIAKVGIAWIDSEAASTTTDLQPYLPMLQSIARMYSEYLPPNDPSTEFAQLVGSLSESEFQALLENIPTGITSREPAEFATFDGVTVSELKAAITS